MRFESAALIVVRRLVNEIIVAFLGTLPLDQQPESKPFTPFAARVGGTHRVTPRGHRLFPGDDHNRSSRAATTL